MNQVISSLFLGLFAPTDSVSRGDRKRGVALFSILASALISSIKMVIGLLSGSIALIADATQGLLDVFLGGFTYLSINEAEKATDPAYTYGRHKIEAMTAIIECVILVVIAFGFLFLGLNRLLAGSVTPHVEGWFIAWLLFAIISDFGRYTILHRTANETGSVALGANSIHFLVDSIASLVVLGGLVLVWMGFAQADTYAAILVSAFIAFSAYKVGRRATDVLTDRVDPQLSFRTLEAVRSVAGVSDVEVLRIRHSGLLYFAESVVKVTPDANWQDVVAIEGRVEEAIRLVLGDSTILVKASP
ncbi:cation diffusion facilitator family transporter [Pelagibacterium lentulum]|uniref:Cation transporter n=1 Tax=Pelagibacterium lentulum TaxID=2029865 RepID=A0A916VVV6_9HYPH|nr:cation diffusion facilitator family transporter [Pelagibacterium lentulum]GGA41755.1 cation transporter [Pelagibacterium lentulum]